MELEETIKYLSEHLRIEVDTEAGYYDEPPVVIVSLFIGDQIISRDSVSLPC